MANFCPKCGGKVNPDDRFCKICGATLAGPAEVPKEELRPEKPPVPVQIPSKPSGPSFTAPIQAPPKPSRSSWPAIISDILGGLIGLGILYLIFYSYNCATGKYPNTQDQMCQSIYQAFSGGGGGGGGTSGGGGGGGSQVSIACQHCSPGYCWTEGHCCPSSAQFYCNGYCYRSSGDAYSAGCHQSGWTRYCCY